MRDQAWRDAFIFDGDFKRLTCQGARRRKAPYGGGRGRQASSKLPSATLCDSCYHSRVRSLQWQTTCLAARPAYGQQPRSIEFRKALEPGNAARYRRPPAFENRGGRNPRAPVCDRGSQEWPDVDRPASFARGFQSVGDVQISGVFRAIEPEMSATEFATLYASIDATHDQ